MRKYEYAWRLVSVAKERGHLPNLKRAVISCVDCGGRATTYDHRNYEYPLWVAAVCRQCNLRRGPGLNRNAPYTDEELKLRGKSMGRKIMFKDMSNPWQRFRSQTGMSQAALGRELGVSQVHICSLETSKRVPSPMLAQKFVDLAKSRRVRMSLQEIYPKADRWPNL